MFRKNLVPTVIVSVIAATFFSAAVLFAKQVEHVSQTQATCGVEINLRVVRLLPEKWEFELSARNSSSEAVFITTAPIRSNGSKGGYFALDPKEPATLNIGVQLYQPPDYSIYSNQTRVTLKRLEPGATHVEEIVLSFPAKETSPPYQGLEYETLDKGKIRGVRATIGILPDDEGIRDFLRRKQGIGPYAGGIELIQRGSLNGKSLYEVQQIIRTPLLML